MAPDRLGGKSDLKRYFCAVHMEDGNSMSSGGAKTTGCRSKTPGIPTSTRLQRNQAEKERRDKLNGFISELATLVPMVSNASKPLDKVSILRLAAAEMRLHFSCLNPKKYKKKPLTLPPSIMASLDVIEKTIGGFVIVTTLTGLIVFCSRSIEDYLGYQNIDVMGNKIMKYIYEDDIKYFEAKVSSVVSNLKKASKKKTKVIKAHMLQKPLPRSNDSCRPRNMIFKLSVHQNDINDNNGCGLGNHTGALKKTRIPKDFGYSAVVLMFIEPVRLEPEIDITYIDSTQDIYFTRHGLQGEIIYADQRISTITGYMPHEVQGTSAYQYICSSDVPIALFAQKAMFTSNDGKGDIVYRLRVRDMRFIYLQSSGQIAYKESSNEISHFVCFNKLLSEEEGSQELKKFQQRFAPQIMAAKMLQVRQNSVGSQSSSNKDKALTLVDNSPTALDVLSPAASISSFKCSKVSSPEVILGVNDQMAGDGLMSPSSSSTTAMSVHSSEGHSMTSPYSIERSNSITPEHNGCASDPMDFVVEKTELMSPVSTDGNNTLSSGSYEPVIVRKGDNFRSDISGNGASGLSNNLLVINDLRCSETAISGNGFYRIQQSDPCVDATSQIMHSVNAFSTTRSNAIAKGSLGDTLTDQAMDLNFDYAVLQKNTLECNTGSSNSNVYGDKAIGLAPALNVYQNQYTRHNGQTSKLNHHFANSQNGLQLATTRSTIDNVLGEQRRNLGEEHVSPKRLSLTHDTSSFSMMYEIPSVSSLPKHSNSQMSVVPDLADTVDYLPGINSYHDNGNCSNSYSPTSVSSYNSGANETTYNNLDVSPNVFDDANTRDMNNFHASASSQYVLSTFPAVNSCQPVDTSIRMTAADPCPEKTLANMEFLTTGFSGGTVNSITPMSVHQTDIPNAYSNLCEPDLTPLDWTGNQAASVAGVDLDLNKELYQELDLFFQNLPQSDSPKNSGDAEPVAEFPAASSYFQNSISSSKAKRHRHQ